MKTAEEFYNKIGDDEKLNDAIELDAARLAIADSTLKFNNVTYKVYIFQDGSELRFGDNGNVGCAIPPLPEEQG